MQTNLVISTKPNMWLVQVRRILYGISLLTSLMPIRIISSTGRKHSMPQKLSINISSLSQWTTLVQTRNLQTLNRKTKRKKKTAPNPSFPRQWILNVVVLRVLWTLKINKVLTSYTTYGTKTLTASFRCKNLRICFRTWAKLSRKARSVYFGPTWTQTMMGKYPKKSSNNSLIKPRRNRQLCDLSDSENCLDIKHH